MICRKDLEIIILKRKLRAAEHSIEFLKEEVDGFLKENFDLEVHLEKAETELHTLKQYLGDY